MSGDRTRPGDRRSALYRASHNCEDYDAYEDLRHAKRLARAHDAVHAIMHLLVLINICLLLATTSLSAKDSAYSHDRDLPPLRLAAGDLDTILQKTRSLIAAVDGPSDPQEVIRESVKLDVRGHEIELPHFSTASSVAFPKKIFRFCYTYYRPDKPISFVTLDFSDYSRRVSVSGESVDQVETKAEPADASSRLAALCFPAR